MGVRATGLSENDAFRPAFRPILYIMPAGLCNKRSWWEFYLLHTPLSQPPSWSYRFWHKFRFWMGYFKVKTFGTSGTPRTCCDLEGLCNETAPNVQRFQVFIPSLPFGWWSLIPGRGCLTTDARRPSAMQGGLVISSNVFVARQPLWSVKWVRNISRVPSDPSVNDRSFVNLAGGVRKTHIFQV